MGIDWSRLQRTRTLTTTDCAAQLWCMFSVDGQGVIVFASGFDVVLRTGRAAIWEDNGRYALRPGILRLDSTCKDAVSDESPTRMFLASELSEADSLTSHPMRTSATRRHGDVRSAPCAVHLRPLTVDEIPM